MATTTTFAATTFINKLITQLLNWPCRKAGHTLFSPRRLFVQTPVDWLCKKNGLTDSSPRSAPAEHDVYSLFFLLGPRSSGAQWCFGVFSYMPLLTERNH